MLLRVGLEAWSVWTVYLLVGTMQLVLIGMGAYFAIRDRKEPGEGKSTAVEEDDLVEGWNAYAHSGLGADERSLLLPKRRAADAR
ncbi:hypothetical protein LTR12_007486 [Friedmanniomyces endolithicus]|nr:hypothetical protein LTR74_006642 [Friedmanniomyces endolithicus]KAK1818079.1 hypothetical protein LTR12_007486 [Friedmanniomyces endolithicus]